MSEVQPPLQKRSAERGGEAEHFSGPKGLAAMQPAYNTININHLVKSGAAGKDPHLEE